MTLLSLYLSFSALSLSSSVVTALDPASIEGNAIQQPEPGSQ